MCLFVADLCCFINFLVQYIRDGPTANGSKFFRKWVVNGSGFILARSLDLADYSNLNMQEVRGLNMQKIEVVEPREVLITVANLEQANLSEFERLEVNLLNYAAVVLPGEMTAMELIQASEALNDLAVRLLNVVTQACPRCDCCGMEEPCELMTDEINPKVVIPAEDLLEAGIEPGSKLVCQADPEHQRMIVYGTDGEYDLSDVDSEVLDIFRECNVCLRELDKIIVEDTAIYPSVKNSKST